VSLFILVQSINAYDYSHLGDFERGNKPIMKIAINLVFDGFSYAISNVIELVWLLDDASDENVRFWLDGKKIHTSDYNLRGITSEQLTLMSFLPVFEKTILIG
jgi:hypothetical protein